MPAPWLPEVVSMGCLRTAPGDGFSGHAHAFDELCMVADAATTIRHAGVERRAPAGTLFLFRAGEDHAYRNGQRQAPALWVLHFRRDPQLVGELPQLIDNDPERRVWRLDAEASARFQSGFANVLAEHRRRGHAARAGESAWLRLLLIALARGDEPAAAATASAIADPELMRLWQALSSGSGSADIVLARRFPNYDALRHRFRERFGQSPRAFAASLRIERAKNLLLERTSTVAAVAAALGYRRVQEFSRAFRRAVGCSPRAWRRAPR